MLIYSYYWHVHNYAIRSHFVIFLFDTIPIFVYLLLFLFTLLVPTAR